MRARNEVFHKFFVDVRWTNIDVLDQEPGFFPWSVSTLSRHVERRFELIIGDIIATSAFYTVFEVFLPCDPVPDGEYGGTHIIGLLRVTARLVPPQWNGAQLPAARLGKITTEMEIEQWDKIGGGMNDIELQAHFPPGHPLSVSRIWDYIVGDEVPWVDHWA